MTEDEINNMSPAQRLSYMDDAQRFMATTEPKFKIGDRVYAPPIGDGVVLYRRWKSLEVPRFTKAEKDGTVNVTYSDPLFASILEASTGWWYAVLVGEQLKWAIEGSIMSTPQGKMIGKITLELPKATDGGGWTIHPDFLKSILQATEKNYPDEDQMTMEALEAVLLHLMNKSET